MNIKIHSNSRNQLWIVAFNERGRVIESPYAGRTFKTTRGLNSAVTYFLRSYPNIAVERTFEQVQP